MYLPTTSSMFLLTSTPPSKMCNQTSHSYPLVNKPSCFTLSTHNSNTKRPCYALACSPKPRFKGDPLLTLPHNSQCHGCISTCHPYLILTNFSQDAYLQPQNENLYFHVRCICYLFYTSSQSSPID